MALQLPWPSQQGVAGPQVCPKSAHPAPLWPAAPPSPLLPPAPPPAPPPDPPAPLLVQLPRIEPTGTIHCTPVQQSAVVVQAPPPATQVVPQRRWPVESGTQGEPLQQSCADAQAPPALTQVVIALQRGMPVPSSLQQSFPEVQAQQSLRVELTEQPPLLL